MQDTNNRVVMVINFLATHPTETFTLSELSERLNISTGSAHRVLKSLTEAKYLQRHPKHKTYSLGLAMAAIGHAAMEKHSYIEKARREMEILARDLNLQCIAISVVEDEMLTLVRTGRPKTAQSYQRVGERRPFSPPFGLVSAAWATSEVKQKYLERLALKKDNPHYDYLQQSIEQVRKRGFSIAAFGPTLEKIHHATLAYEDSPFDEALKAHSIELMGQLSEEELQLQEFPPSLDTQISHISAPVFSPSGEVALEIVITGSAKMLPVEEITHYRDRLCAVAEYVTSETHGRAPVSSNRWAANL